MITSKHILEISEKWSKTVKVWNARVPVYENPGSSDYLELHKDAKKDKRTLGYMRFVANSKDQKVYIWDDYLATHADVIKTLGISSKNPWVLTGYIEIKGGSPEASEWWKDAIGDYSDYDWAWMSRYFKLSSELKKSLGIK